VWSRTDHNHSTGQAGPRPSWPARTAGSDTCPLYEEGFTELVSGEYGSIRDTVYSIIGHGLATRFPDIRFMPMENGSQWAPTAIKQFKKIYAMDPGSWDEDRSSRCTVRSSSTRSSRRT
jgi:hypothetical protein